MSEVILAHSGLMGGSHSLFVFLPFLSLGVGLYFIVLATKDQKGRKKDPSVPRLPTPKEQPLRYVHTALRAHKKERTGPPKREEAKLGRRDPGRKRLRRV
jgi:hypothetical protein